MDNLFGEKIRGAVSQKAACLKLYGQYAPPGAEARAWKKESDLSPDTLEQFQRIWDKTAPERCRECAKASAPGQRHPVRRLGNAFCSAQCAEARGAVFSCRECNEPVSAERPHCARCGWGLSGPAPAPANRGQRRSRLDDMVEENEKNVAQWLKRVRCVQRPDANHEPAWKRRRRS